MQILPHCFDQKTNAAQVTFRQVLFLYKYILQFGQIQLAICTNTLSTLPGCFDQNKGTAA